MPISVYVTYSLTLKTNKMKKTKNKTITDFTNLLFIKKV